jgi:hypothetical protein
MRQAWRYAAQELTPTEDAAFTHRLAYDFAAQNALAEAVRRQALARGLPEPAPHPKTHDVIRHALQTKPTHSSIPYVVATLIAAIALAGIMPYSKPTTAIFPNEMCVTGLPLTPRETMFQVRLPGETSLPVLSHYNADRTVRPADRGGK